MQLTKPAPSTVAPTGYDRHHALAPRTPTRRSAVESYLIALTSEAELMREHVSAATESLRIVQLRASEIAAVLGIDISSIPVKQ